MILQYTSFRNTSQSYPAVLQKLAYMEFHKTYFMGEIMQIYVCC